MAWRSPRPAGANLRRESGFSRQHSSHCSDRKSAFRVSVSDAVLRRKQCASVRSRTARTPVCPHIGGEPFVRKVDRDQRTLVRSGTYGYTSSTISGSSLAHPAILRLAAEPPPGNGRECVLEFVDGRVMDAELVAFEPGSDSVGVRLKAREVCSVSPWLSFAQSN